MLMKQARIVPYRGNDQRSGEYPGFGVPDLHGIAWQFQADAPVATPLVTANGLVLFGTTDHSFDHCFSALDAQTGDIRWQYRTRGAVTTPAAVMDGVVYLGDEAGLLYALSLQTGRLLWTWTHDALLSEPELSTLYADSSEVDAVMGLGGLFAHLRNEQEAGMAPPSPICWLLPECST
jgi:outer membrane protein assembly factor BamB